MNDGSFSVKKILGYATLVIAASGPFILVISVLFNLSYLVQLGSRTIFIMTLSDYLSLSIATLPLFAVPFVMVTYVCLFFAIPYYASSSIEENPKLRSQILPWLATVALIIGFATVRTEIIVLLTPFLMIVFFISYNAPQDLFHKASQRTISFFVPHAVITAFYLFLFLKLLWDKEFRAILPVAGILLVVEILILLYTYHRLPKLSTITMIILHFVNISLFSSIIGGVLFAESDKSLHSHAVISVRNFADDAANGSRSYSHYTMENMILLRGMERGLLLWDGVKKEKIFVTWDNIISIKERVED